MLIEVDGVIPDCAAVIVLLYLGNTVGVRGHSMEYLIVAVQGCCLVSVVLILKGRQLAPTAKVGISTLYCVIVELVNFVKVRDPWSSTG